MEPKSSLDRFGVTALVGFSLLLAFNQVVIKVSSGGLQPIFLAGLRSLGAIVCLVVVMGLRRRFAAHQQTPQTGPRAGPRTEPRAGPPIPARWGLAVGAVFTVEFMCLFTALDLTSVSRASVIFYSMPFWAALGAQMFLGETMSRIKLLGLIAAFCGMAWAIFDPSEARQGQILGDLAALGAAIGWAATLILLKGTPLKHMAPDKQLLWQVGVSAPVLLLMSPLFGPLIREVAPLHWAGLGFQIALVAFGFQFWFWLIKIYPAGAVASFSFLAPIFSVALGWLLLGEVVGPSLIGALALVTLGLYLSNKS